MKKATELILYNELHSDGFFTFSERDFEANIKRLFEKYLKAEFDSVDELWGAFNVEDVKESEFYKFVFEYCQRFGERFKSSGFEKLLNRYLQWEIANFTGKKRSIKDAKKFVNIVKDSTSDGTLLEVGSGYRLPISSLEFARSLKTPIYSMDTFNHYYEDMDVFKNLGVILIPEMFDDNTDISNYYRIVGESPCSAIRPIVEMCANRDDKEYFITMCDCCSPRNGLSGFVKYLKSKDKNLRSFIVKQEWEYEEHHIIYGDKKLLLNKDDELVECMDDVYVTNSHKHNDDIMSAIAREWGLTI